ncbi:MAG TPA: cyclopropane-fatty-acyl-phospholipid synthase family protein [Burkholderiales bacterium]|nr:cyclopropane-fatty-acyl-phospholipid synthase family protein [Burkholderiales bacterium]
MFVEARIERFAEKLRKAAALPLRLTLWNGRQIDLDSNPAVTVRISAPSAVRYLLYPSLARLGEAYVEGYLQVEGPIREVVRIAAGLVHNVRTRLPRWEKVRYSMRHSRRRDAKAIEYHYDVSNEFYQLWLDRNLAYSCAYFHGADDSLDSAQEQKFDHICRKLRLAPGERFLDIGCGWGGLVFWAAQRYGVHATGITLSHNQHDYVNARIRELGLADRCQVLLQDYRDLPGQGSFDKIASVGMFEHVGLKNLRVYFGTIGRLLADRGLVMNHGITTMDPDSGMVGMGAGEFIDRYVFPHGELPHLSLAIDAMSREELEVVDVESLRFHYAQTLAYWAQRLEARAKEALALAGERRLRIWLLYLAGCSYAFEQGWVSVHQVLAAKRTREGMAPLPWTRADIYSS